jgi:hypothetical protein
LMYQTCDVLSFLKKFMLLIDVSPDPGAESRPFQHCSPN